MVILFSDVTVAGFTMETGTLQLNGYTLKASGIDITGIQVNSYGGTIEAAFQRWGNNNVYGDFTLYYNSPTASGHQSHFYNHYHDGFIYKINIGDAFIVPYLNSFAGPCRFEVESGSIHLGHYVGEEVLFAGAVEVATSHKGYLTFADYGRVVFTQAVTVTHHTPADVAAYVRFAAQSGSSVLFEQALTIRQGMGSTQLGIDGNCEFRGQVEFHSVPNADTYGGIFLGSPTGNGQHRFSETARLQIPETNEAYTHSSLQMAHTRFETLAQTWKLGADCALYLDQCTFLSPLQVEVPHVHLAGNVFQAEASFTKLAAGENASSGGNTFYGKLTLKNTQPTGKIRMATQTDDTILY